MEKDLDIKLYNDYLDGEKGAFELLYNKYKDKIQYFVYNIVKDYQKAEDITQDVFVYVMQNKIKEGYTFKYYLYLVAKSRAYNQINMEKRRTEINEKYILNGAEQVGQDVADIVNIPVLRKDFIIDEYQIYQAKLIGADAVLLICAVLDESTLKKFINIATSLKLSCLVETHNEEEIKKALNCNAKIIGINNRDLKTFTVDINTSLKLRKFIPENKILISESGIKTAQDIKMLKDAGFNGALIGESMMLSKDKKQFLSELRG